MLAYPNHKTLLLNINFKGVFRTQTNIYGATFLLRKAPSQMFNWVLNTPLKFDLFFLFQWIFENDWFVQYLKKSFFPYRQCNSGQFTVSCPTIDLKLIKKKQAQWISNILMCDIWCLDNCPRGKVPPVGVRVRLSFRIRGRNS